MYDFFDECKAFIIHYYYTIIESSATLLHKTKLAKNKTNHIKYKLLILNLHINQDNVQCGLSNQ